MVKLTVQPNMAIAYKVGTPREHVDKCSIILRNIYVNFQYHKIMLIDLYSVNYI